MGLGALGWGWRRWDGVGGIRMGLGGSEEGMGGIGVGMGGSKVGLGALGLGWGGLGWV